jgi:hypothetical protein
MAMLSAAKIGRRIAFGPVWYETGDARFSISEEVG